jgi:hypothetical protein
MRLKDLKGLVEFIRYDNSPKEIKRFAGRSENPTPSEDREDRVTFLHNGKPYHDIYAILHFHLFKVDGRLVGLYKDRNNKISLHISKKFLNY